MSSPFFPLEGTDSPTSSPSLRPPNMGPPSSSSSSNGPPALVMPTKAVSKSRLPFLSRSKKAGKTDNLESASRKAAELKSSQCLSQRYIVLPSRSSPRSSSSSSPTLGSLSPASMPSPSAPVLHILDMDMELSESTHVLVPRPMEPMPPPRPSTRHPRATGSPSTSSTSSSHGSTSPHTFTANTSSNQQSTSCSNQFSSGDWNSSSVSSSNPSGGQGGTGNTNGTNGSNGFIHKPLRGWLHPDHKITELGITYSVKYVGCLAINTSMRILDFDTRSLIAKECITRVCEAGGLRNVDHTRPSNKRIMKMLSDVPNMDFTGSNVTLNVTSASLNLTVTDSGEVIARHEMPNISFASGGDAEQMDFVSYVAKDTRYGRACFVLQCIGGCAQDVISTIGQAFELRFQEFLKRAPRSTISNPHAHPHQHNGPEEGGGASISSHPVPLSSSESSSLLDRRSSICTKFSDPDRDYYNDLPGKLPPDISSSSSPPPVSTSSGQAVGADSKLPPLQPQSIPRISFLKQKGNVPLPLGSTNAASKGLISTIDASSSNLIDLSLGDDPFASTSNYDSFMHDYVNCKSGTKESIDFSSGDTLKEAPPTPTTKDPFDMQPFNNTLNDLQCKDAFLDANCNLDSLEKQLWFHGPINRKESELLVLSDGDFLVRESQGSIGQYVLTGRKDGFCKHLLLVDPEGVVRTKDRTFDSVCHLIRYHQDNHLPIISAESALHLENPIPPPETQTISS